MLGIKSFHNDKFALVISLHRSDLVEAGLPEQLKNMINDNTLLEIADRLRNALLNSGYRECLSTIIDEMGLKNKLMTCADYKNCDDCPMELDCEPKIDIGDEWRGEG